MNSSKMYFNAFNPVNDKNSPENNGTNIILGFLKKLLIKIINIFNSYGNNFYPINHFEQLKNTRPKKEKINESKSYKNNDILMKIACLLCIGVMLIFVITGIIHPNIFSLPII